jgi:hypothetical protein
MPKIRVLKVTTNAVEELEVADVHEIPVIEGFQVTSFSGVSESGEAYDWIAVPE